MKVVGSGRRRWLALVATLAAVAAVAFVVWRPTPGGQQEREGTARPPDAAGAADVRAITPDAGPSTPDAARPDAAPDPDLRRKQTGRNPRGVKKKAVGGAAPVTTPRVKPDSRPPRPSPRKPDAAVKGVKKPKPGPANVGEGTIDPFGDVKSR